MLEIAPGPGCGRSRMGHDGDSDEIEEVVTAPRSLCQHAYAERLIGSIRRECLDHVIVWNARACDAS
jgi:hypothetical protein